MVELDIYSHSYFRKRFVIQRTYLCFCLQIVPKFVCNLLFCLTPLWSEGSKLSMCNYSLEHICLVCICSYNCCLFLLMCVEECFHVHVYFSACFQEFMSGYEWGRVWCVFVCILTFMIEFPTCPHNIFRLMSHWSSWFPLHCWPNIRFLALPWTLSVHLSGYSTPELLSLLNLFLFEKAEMYKHYLFFSGLGGKSLITWLNVIFVWSPCRKTSQSLET